VLKVSAALASLAMAVSLSAVAVPASADSKCVITGFTPRTVVVGLSPVVRTFDVQTAECNEQGWNLSTDSVYAYSDNPEEVFDTYSNSQAGPQDAVASAYNEDYYRTNRVFIDGFTLKRRTAWQSGSFNASPEPVAKGSAIRIKGRLIRANWDTQAYAGYSGRTVSIEFRTVDGSYSRVKTATTGTGGYLSTTVTAVRDGVWRVRYLGNSVSGPATAVGDFVNVVG
jgi:hypothetical protein